MSARASEIPDALARPTVGRPAVRNTTSAPRVVPPSSGRRGARGTRFPARARSRSPRRGRPRAPPTGASRERPCPVRRRRPELEPDGRRAADRVDRPGEGDREPRQAPRARRRAARRSSGSSESARTSCRRRSARRSGSGSPSPAAGRRSTPLRRGAPREPGVDLTRPATEARRRAVLEPGHRPATARVDAAADARRRGRDRVGAARRDGRRAIRAEATSAPPSSRCRSRRRGGSGTSRPRSGRRPGRRRRPGRPAPAERVSVREP